VYDGLGRKTSSALSEAGGTPGGSWIVTTYGYDGRGRPNCVSLPFRGSAGSGCAVVNGAIQNGVVGAVTQYDGLGRPTQVVEADGSITRSAYANNQTVVRDAAGFVRLSGADGAGRLKWVQENPATWGLAAGAFPAGIAGQSSLPTYTTSYGYDPLNNLKCVSQNQASLTDCTSGNATRSFQYDSLKRLVQAVNPENGTLTYRYDGSGNLASRADSVRTLAFSAYDGVNRALGKSYTDGITPAVTYGYGDQSFAPPACKTQGGGVCGRLVSVTSTPAIGTVVVNNYSNFDSTGRVTASSQQFGGAAPYAFSYTYDLSGALASVKYPSGRTVTNAFDAAGRICGVNNGTTANCTSNLQYASNVSYAPQGAVQSLTLYNGVSETWGFNTLQQPNSLTAAHGGTALMTLGWTYNNGANNGNVAGHTIQRSSGLPAMLSQAFTYVDPANRLKTAFETGGPSQTYLYDAFGNRAVQAGSWVPNLALTPQSALATPATFPTSQFTNNQWKSNTGDAYDGVGNQTQLAASSGIFTYDGENRLLSANVLGEGTVTFAYDGEGHRMQKASGLGTTTYVHDAMGNLAAEYGTQASTATGTQYLTADTLGSTRLVTDVSGNSVRCIDYLPFGEEIPAGQNGRTGCYEGLGGGTSPQYPAPPDVQSLKFTGKERDAETGLDYFGARYFSGAQGRWTSPDWSETPQPVPYADLTDPQTLNLYTYVRNNPLSRTDPDGHCCEGVVDFGEQLVATPSPLVNAGGYFIVGLGVVGTALTSPQVREAISNAVENMPVVKSPEQVMVEGMAMKYSKSPPNPNGSKGAPDHQQTADEEAAKMGPNGQREVRVQTPGGEKGSRVIDAAKVENGKVTEATQVVRPNKSGTPPAREVRAARDIERSTGVNPKLVPVRSLKPDGSQ
jgi:RHS repeat-associated protein